MGVLTALASLIDRPTLVEEEAAKHFHHDPALALALLLSRRSTSAPFDIGKLLQQSGQRLVALYVLYTPRVPGHLTALHLNLWRDSLRVAHLARQLADKLHYADTEAAWFAGLFHNLPEYAALADVPCPPLERLDRHGFLADAVRHCRAPFARLKSAHMLVRLTNAATALGTREQGFDHVDVRAALAALGLDAGEGVRLVQAADLYVQDILLRYGATNVPGGTVGTSHDELLEIYARHAITTQAHHLFRESGEGHAALMAFTEAMGLALGTTNLALLMMNTANNALEAVAGQGPAGMEELPLRLDDTQSFLCRASIGQPAHWAQEQAEQFSVSDAQLGRLLDARSMVAFQVTGTPPQILVAADPCQDWQADPRWSALLAAWTQNHANSSVPATTQAVPLEQVRQVVHEVANPLTIMRNYVNLLSSRLGSDASAQRDLKIIRDEIERATTILRSLAPASSANSVGTQEENPEPVGINQTVSEIVRMGLGTLFAPNRINVQIDLDPSIPPLHLNRDKLKQILLNLTKNAVEAMPQGGRLTFSTRLQVGDNDSRVAIHIQDSGPGLPEEIKTRLFEPQASTKGGDHAGLGLAISRNLARSLDGDIHCQSSSVGTVFTVLLPAGGQFTLPERAAVT